MQLKTSCFNPTLFKKNLTRFWPMWALYGLFWFLTLPASMFRELEYMDAGFCDDLLVTMGSQPGILITFGFGVLCAMALFSYLFQHRSAVAMHAFPMRRECLFLTNYLSGLAFFTFPLLANFALVLWVELVAGQLNVGTALVWLTAQLCYALFFYSFAVFCAMFTGHILALPAFYGILSVLPVVLAALISEALSLFVFGYTSDYSMHAVSMVFSPLEKLLTEVEPRSRLLSEVGDTIYYMTGWGWIFLYAVVGVLFTLAALLVYRRRQVESAGDVVSVRLVRPLFLYGVATCAALTFGMFLFALFGDEDDLAAAWQLLAFMVIAGFIGYFAAQMLLNKTLRVWRGHWKGFLAFSAALVLVVTAMEMDLLGFERDVPDPEKVAAVSLNGSSYPPYDDYHFDGYTYESPEAIAQAVALHQTIVDQRETIQQEVQSLYDGRFVEPVPMAVAAEAGESLPDTEPQYYYPEDRTLRVELTYTMKNGSLVQRSYLVWAQETDLNDPGSMESQLQALLNRPEHVTAYFGDWTEDQLSGVDVHFYDVEDLLKYGAGDVYEYEDGPIAVPEDAEAQEWQNTYNGEDARTLFRAVGEDLANGRIGVCWIVPTLEYKQVSLNSTLDFTFRKLNKDGEYSYKTVPITVTRNSTATLTALQELGFLDERLNLLSVK